MARCVISVVHDGDDGAQCAACMVHAAHWPCQRDGEPADPAPVHAFQGTREQAIRVWELRTARQRPLIIHAATIPDPEDHVFETTVLPCPCGAEILPAEAGL